MHCEHVYLNSAFRNRTQYPNPNQYIVPFTLVYSRPELSSDFVLDAAPFHTGEVTVSIPSTAIDVAAANSSDTSITVVDTSGFPASGTLTINAETYSYKVVDATTFNITTPGGLAANYAIGVTVESFESFILDPSASDIDNYYAGSLIEVNIGTILIPNYEIKEIKRIISYDGTTKTVILESGLSQPPVVGGQYYIRNELPEERDKKIQAVTGTFPNISEIKLDPSSQTVDDFYNGKYLYIRRGTSNIDPVGDIYKITDYTGGAQTADVKLFRERIQDNKGNNINSHKYDILSAPHCPNDQGLIYPGSIIGKNQQVDYDIRLISLTIPNQPLFYGGNITDYPYLMVEFGNINTLSTYISTNNPRSRKRLFIVPIVDTNTNTLPFLNLKCKMIQTIKYTPVGDHRFAVYLPDGRILRYADDRLPPLIPDRYLQTSAVFEARLIR
jgi:hypothetical protein